MPPKRKGDNVRGKDKLFKHAIEHVHVGVGYHVLGNVSMELAAGPPPSATTSTTIVNKVTQPSALFLELNEQLLKNSSKDFRTFRYEVGPLCETVALFELNHKQIAEKLLSYLMKRESGSFSSTKSQQKHGLLAAAAAADGGGKTEQDQNMGATTEAFEAFARLTVAFVRDLQDNFFPYFEVFQKTLYLGIFDKNGRLLMNQHSNNDSLTYRLQLIYMVQAAWCRELQPYWDYTKVSRRTNRHDNNNKVLIERILRLYIHEYFKDTKVYIRRLTAELLAYLCRIEKKLLTFVVEEVGREIIKDFDSYLETTAEHNAALAAAARAAEASNEIAGADEQEDGEESNSSEGDTEEEEGEEEGTGSTPATAAAVATALHDRRHRLDVSERALLYQYMRTDLLVNPTLNGFYYLCCELLRGLRGSLSSYCEYYYVYLLDAFYLIENEAVRKEIITTRLPFLAPYFETKVESKEEEEDDDEGATSATATATTLHAADFEALLHQQRAEEDDEDEDEDEGDSHAHAAPPLNLLLFKEVGQQVLSECLQTIMTETRKNSASKLQRHHDDEKHNEAGAEGARLEHASITNSERDLIPSERLFAMVLHCFNGRSTYHVKIVTNLLNAAEYFLWNHFYVRSGSHSKKKDDMSSNKYYALFAQLQSGVKYLTEQLGRLQLQKQGLQEEALQELDDMLQYSAAILEFARPLCLSPYLADLMAQEEEDAQGEAEAQHAMGHQKNKKELKPSLELQTKCMAIAQKAVHMTLQVHVLVQDQLSLSAAASAAPVWSLAQLDEKALLLLVAFTQDVLQKNYAFCQEEERRASEEGIRSVSQRHEEKDEAEEVYDDLSEDEDGARRTQRRRSQGPTRYSDAAGATSSHLTPCGLTLLHAICLPLWQQAAQQVGQDLHPRHDSASASASVQPPPQALSAVALDMLKRRFVEKSVLVARLLCDRTANTRTSPLQQLMRLSKKNEDKHASHPTSSISAEGDDCKKLSSVLHRLIVKVIAEFVACLQAGAKIAPEDTQHYAELLSAVLPITIHYNNHNSNSSSTTTSPTSEKEGIEYLLGTILDTIKKNNPNIFAVMTGNTAEANHKSSGSNSSRGAHATLHTTLCSLYTQISAFMIHLHQQQEQQPKRKLKGKKGTSSGGETAAVVDTAAMQSSMKHIGETIHYLSVELRRTSGQNSNTRHVLLHATSMLLESLLLALRLTNEVAEGEEGERKTGETVHAASLRALAQLQSVLSSAQQRELIYVVLTESLTAPVQYVRMTALRLLCFFAGPHASSFAVLCIHKEADHEDKQELEDYMREYYFHESSTATSSSSIHVSLADGISPATLQMLLAAERFNPLSHTGDLNYIQSILNPLTQSSSRVASGYELAHPLHKFFVAHHMLGLLHLKYAPLWPLVTQILTNLVAAEDTLEHDVVTSEGGKTTKKKKLESSPAHATPSRYYHEENEEEGEGSGTQKRQRIPLQSPLVWDLVVSHYARLYVLGDLVLPSDKTQPEDKVGEEEEEEEAVVADEAAEAQEAAALVKGTLLRCLEPAEEAVEGNGAANPLCYYAIIKTDQQRHATGELVSRQFSFVSFMTSSVVLVQLADEDNEVLSWKSHFLPSSFDPLLLSSEKKKKGKNGGRSSGNKKNGQNLFEGSTDPSTTAQNFLKAIGEMLKQQRPQQLRRVAAALPFLAALGKNSNALARFVAVAYDKKILLLERVLGEMVLIYRDEHPAGAVHIKQTETRLWMAMQACTSAPSTALIAAAQELLAADHMTAAATSFEEHATARALMGHVQTRNEHLEEVFTTFISENNARLQKSAIDNLKRLKVFPFHTFHTQLLPFCDTNKVLFHFLNTFDMAKDVAAASSSSNAAGVLHDQTVFISTALSIALPKLTVRVNKDKMKEQQMLSRRLLSLISVLQPSFQRMTRHEDEEEEEEMGHSGYRKKDEKEPIVVVLDMLVQRLLFARLGSSEAAAGAANAKESFFFLRKWQKEVRGVMTGDGASSATSPPWHLLRKLEKLMKNLSNILRLLEALMRAAGTQFAGYVPHCYVLCANAYVTACKSLLSEPLLEVEQQLQHAAAQGARGTSEDEREAALRPVLTLQRWCRSIQGGLRRSKTLNQLLASVRRSAVGVMASLFEQFPTEVMAAVRDDYETSTAAAAKVDAHASPSLIELYIQQLVSHYQQGSASEQPRGRMSHAAALSGGGRGGNSESVKRMPFIKLLQLWIAEPVLYPLVTLFGKEIKQSLCDVFSINQHYEDGSSFRSKVYKHSSEVIFTGLRCVTDMLKQADEPVQPLTAAPPAKTTGGRSVSSKKQKKVKLQEEDAVLTLRTTFMRPHMMDIFSALYALVIRSSRNSNSSTNNMVTRTDEAEEEDGEPEQVDEEAQKKQAMDKKKKKQMKRNKKKKQQQQRQKQSSASSNKDRYRVMSFTMNMWKEIIQTISMMTKEITSPLFTEPHQQHEQQQQTSSSSCRGAALQGMLLDLLEVALRFVSHPLCVTEPATLLFAVHTVLTLLEHVQPVTELQEGWQGLDVRRHLHLLTHTLNMVTHPEARSRLCDALQLAIHRLNYAPIIAAEATIYAQGAATGDVAPTATATATASVYEAQFAAVGRAVKALNSFDAEEGFEKYDFERRYHAFHSLIQFFSFEGNDGGRKTETGEKGTVRVERVYEGEEDVSIPLLWLSVRGKSEAQPRQLALLPIDAMHLLSANIMFYLRDPESTIRAFASQLLHAMCRYVSATTYREHETKLRHHPQLRHLASASSSSWLTKSVWVVYEQRVLAQVIRTEVLSSFRRGAVAKDVLRRHDHLAAMEVLAKYFPAAFPSLAVLYSPNNEQNFYKNINHVQPKCRLNALAMLRTTCETMQPRELLRVFIPFLICAVKDFSQGKRSLANMTEGRAKGYAEAVLHTIATIAAHLPWEAYLRVLTLFLTNAALHPDMRMSMLRGVVQVLDNFHFLDENDRIVEQADDEVERLKKAEGGEDTHMAHHEEEEEEEEAERIVRAKIQAYGSAKIVRVLEQSIIPQLYAFISATEESKGAGGGGGGGMRRGGEGLGNMHSITAIRKELEKEESSKTTRNALLQLPVAMAITKIVKYFPEDRFHYYVEHLMDMLVRRLRTKMDRHRESARRILGAILQETGPAQLRFVITKLKDNLVHGYQLHVLGYTVVTLLYQIYDPQNAMLARGANKHQQQQQLALTGKRKHGVVPGDVVQEVLQTKSEMAKRQQKQHEDVDSEEEAEAEKEQDRPAKKRQKTEAEAAEEEMDRLDQEEEELLLQLTSTTARRNKHRRTFDYQFGVQCLNEITDDLFLIFLDDYLGEIGHQKEQTELISKMIEVKRNRALQGFIFLAKFGEAEKVMNAFLYRIQWVLTPPKEALKEDQVAQLHGSARARAMLVQEVQNKYTKTSSSKNAGADILFVNKVRLLALRVARSLMANPTMEVQTALEQVHRLMAKHNVVREEKIAEFEAKDGTRRIRGNAHLLIHHKESKSYKEQLDANFMVAPAPERVDVDFSAHTVLATQQKQKLRIYKGRYGKEVREAAKDFYREDPTTAIVLDTLDEFLLQYLRSVLQHVLGIGKEKKKGKAAVQLEVVRSRRKALEEAAQEQDSNDEDDDDNNKHNNSNQEADEAKEEEEEQDGEEKETRQLGKLLEPKELNESEEEDDLDAFVHEQQAGEERGDEEDEVGGKPRHGREHKRQKKKKLSSMQDLVTIFTTSHQSVLESLIPVMVQTLKGEGSDAVVAIALDCLLAFSALRPPLATVTSLHQEIFHTVLLFLPRGGAIKQRALRVCAAIVSLRTFTTLSDEQARQLLHVCRVEIINRSVMLPMALSLLYSLLGKHIYLPEVYDLMDLITELMMHLSGKEVIRRRCVALLVRFLTEYKMTPQRFKSHIELFVKNLNYPEMGGRIALLEVLEALVRQLPTVVLQEEAPFLFVPLSATLTSCEHREVRELAGRVLQKMTKNAGVDRIAPVLLPLLDETQQRPTRTMAAQTWAAILPALPTLYELAEQSTSATSTTTRSIRIKDDDDAEEFTALCAWSLPSLLLGCYYDPTSTKHKKKKKAGEVKTDSRAKASQLKKKNVKEQLKGWSYIFYALRCVETLVEAAPLHFFPLIFQQDILQQHHSEATSFIDYCIDHLLLHPHPWVHAVTLRILRCYFYTFVEEKSCFLSRELTLRHRSDAAAATTTAADSDVELPFVFTGFRAAEEKGEDVHKALLEQFTQYALLTRKLLQLVASSDVANEVYKANRAIISPSRHELIRLLLFTTKSMSHLALTLLVDLRRPHATRATTAASATVVCAYEAAITAQYHTVLRGVLTKTAAPILQQGSVVNYMVRASSLCQYAGGLVSLLPRVTSPPATAADEGENHQNNNNNNSNEEEEEQEGTEEEREEAAANAAVTKAAVHWLLKEAIQVLPLITHVLAPLLNIAIKASPFSEKLSSLANQSIHVTQKQLEERRELFLAADGELLSTTAPTTSGKRQQKRGREGEEEEEDKQDAHLAAGESKKMKKKKSEQQQQQPQHAVPTPTRDAKKDEVTLQEALTCLSTGISIIKERKRISTIKSENKKAVKRRRHDELKQQQQ